MEERKGLFTDEGQKVLDDILKLKGAAEAVDGIAITLIDNLGLEVLKKKAEEKYPGVTEEYLYPIADVIIEGLKAILAAAENKK
jgi:hypothetical protein